MTLEKISIQQARKLAVKAQLFSSVSEERKLLPKDAAAQIIEHLGYLQIDTINVIERSHHHILWTRSPAYQPDIIHQLLAKDRRIFEYWAHATSYLPISDYRFYLPRMSNFRESGNRWIKQLYEISGHLMEPAFTRIKKEGPLSIADFKEEGQSFRTPWGAIKPMKFALELLFWRGDLMVTERRKFQKVYDLTERVLPGDVNCIPPGENELGLFLVRRALQSYGIAKENEIKTFLQPEATRDAQFQAAGEKIILKTLTDLLDSGEVVKLTVKNMDNHYFAARKMLEESPVIEDLPDAVYLLSPFDNLIVHRKRTKWLFDFDYSLECYTPAAKRKYGFFVLPVLWKEQLVGRIDPKADRKNFTMILNTIQFEDWFEVNEDFILSLSEKIAAFSKFNRCRKIEYGKQTRDKITLKILRLSQDFLNKIF
jgi:uncharacterized protein YcaQ